LTSYCSDNHQIDGINSQIKDMVKKSRDSVISKGKLLDTRDEKEYCAVAVNLKIPIKSDKSAH